MRRRHIDLADQEVIPGGLLELAGAAVIDEGDSPLGLLKLRVVAREEPGLVPGDRIGSPGAASQVRPGRDQHERPKRGVGGHPAGAARRLG